MKSAKIAAKKQKNNTEKDSSSYVKESNELDSICAEICADKE